MSMTQMSTTQISMTQMNMTQGDRYRALPGRRRGISRGAGVWIGGDHLLSVKSYRFREEYKRFHLRDVQAIVVAKAPRFHISTRSLFIGALWSLAYLLRSINARFEYLTPALYMVAGGLVAAWLLISARFSCRCHILTAVSSDELPSVYRTWTARRFLAKVEPGIEEAQGCVEGNWAEVLEARGNVRAPGPEDVTAGAVEGSVSGPGKLRARTRTLVSDLFIAILFINSAVGLFTLHSSVAVVSWLTSGLVLVEFAAAAGIFTQHYRGILRSGMPRLAIAAVIKTGIAYYIGLFMVSFVGAKYPGVDKAALMALPPYILLRQIDVCLDALLGLVGAGVAVGSDRFTD
jgi:hypothetical protein